MSAEQEQQAATAEVATKAVTAAPVPSSDVTLVLRPCVCHTESQSQSQSVAPSYWRMSEDVVMRRPLASSLADLAQVVEELLLLRGAASAGCRHRMQLRLKGKVVPENRMRWTLRRMAIIDDTVIQVEPTLQGSWWWFTIDEYIDQLLNSIGRVLDSQPQNGIYLHDLEKIISVPPPIKKTLRTFIRSYPDIFHMYCYTPDNSFWIRRTHGLIDLPVFSNVPHDLGLRQHFVPKIFNWEDYQDIDDKYKIETFETVEEQAARIEREAYEREVALKMGGEEKVDQKRKSRKKKSITEEDGDDLEEGEGMDKSDDDDDGDDDGEAEEEEDEENEKDEKVEKDGSENGQEIVIDKDTSS